MRRFYIDTRANHPVSTWTHPLSVGPPPQIGYGPYGGGFYSSGRSPGYYNLPQAGRYGGNYITPPPQGGYGGNYSIPPLQSGYGRNYNIPPPGYGGNYSIPPPQSGGYGGNYIISPPQSGDYDEGYSMLPPQSGGYGRYKYPEHQPGRPQPQSYNQPNNISGTGLSSLSLQEFSS